MPQLPTIIIRQWNWKVTALKYLLDNEIQIPILMTPLVCKHHEIEKVTDNYLCFV